MADDNNEVDRDAFWEITDIFWEPMQIVLDDDGILENEKEKIIAKYYLELGARMAVADIFGRLAVHVLVNRHTNDNNDQYQGVHFTVEEAKHEMQHWAEVLNLISRQFNEPVRWIHEYFTNNTSLEEDYFPNMINELEENDDCQ